MTFLLLSIQSAVCVIVVWTVKRMGIITCMSTLSRIGAPLIEQSATLTWPMPKPGSLSLPSSSRSSTPGQKPYNSSLYQSTRKTLRVAHQLTYSIFKNLTIILIAYGEVFMFGNSVTGLTLVAFGLMVRSSAMFTLIGRSVRPSSRHGQQARTSRTTARRKPDTSGWP
jgi:GDP-mannose transporter